MSTTKWLFITCGLYVVLSLFLFFKVPNSSCHMDIDSSAYTEQVENFEAHGTFLNPGQIGCTSYASPNYPLFMVITRILLGYNYKVVIFVQILLVLLMILLIFQISSWLFTRKVALLATFLSAINIGFITMPQFILADTLITFLILAGFERLIVYYCEGMFSSIIASGLLFGVSIIVKPFALFYVFCLSLLLIISSLKDWRFLFKAATLFTLAFLLPIGAYTVRNKMTYGYYFLTAQDRINLHFYFLPKVLIESEGLSRAQAIKKIKKEGNYGAVKELASGQGWKEMDQYFLNMVMRYPLLSLKIWFFNVMKTSLGLYFNQLKLLLYENLTGGDCSYFKFSGNWWDKILNYLTFGMDSKSLIFIGFWEIVWSIFRYLAVAIALIYLLIKRRYLTWVLFASNISYFALITGHDGCGRYRFVFEAPLIILSALGFIILFNVITRRKSAVLTGCLD